MLTGRHNYVAVWVRAIQSLKVSIFYTDHFCPTKFTPDIYTDISAISETFCNSACSFFNIGIDSKHHLPLHLWCISQHGTVQSSAALLTEFFVFKVREEVFLPFMLSFQMLPTILCQLACLFAIGNAQLPNYANNEVGRSINKPFSNFVDLPSQRLKA